MESVTLRADHAAYCRHGHSATASVTLPSLHWVLKVSRSVVEALTSVGQLASSSSQEVRIRRIWSRAPRHKCILVNLLIPRLRRALVIVLVRRAAYSAHGSHS